MSHTGGCEVVARRAGKISKLENEKMRELVNGIRATSLQHRRLTLPKFQTLAKCVPLKVTHLSHRKETEKFGRELREILMEKGY